MKIALLVKVAAFIFALFAIIQAVNIFFPENRRPSTDVRVGVFPTDFPLLKPSIVQSYEQNTFALPSAKFLREVIDEYLKGIYTRVPLPDVGSGSATLDGVTYGLASFPRKILQDKFIVIYIDGQRHEGRDVIGLTVMFVNHQEKLYQAIITQDSEGGYVLVSFSEAKISPKTLREYQRLAAPLLAKPHLHL
jgi:hypothetical protein